MYRKLILYLLAVLTILFQSVGIENMDPEEKKKISVEIKGEVEKQGVYEMDLGSTLEDLLKSAKPYPDADLSSFSLQKRLHHLELVVVKKKEKRKLVS
ncbi:MAG: hypothetical protein IKO97_08315, partial [Erysipelotrichaceae bacterium]|nr:hypothetical protein [Erysipelotrichaceae bacterium]